MSSRTFIFIKPDAIERSLTGAIKSFFRDKGFKILREKTVTTSAEQILFHYRVVLERVKTPGFKEGLLKEFVNRDIILIELESSEDQSVERVRALIGATDPAKADKETIRGKYGVDSIAKATEDRRMLQNLIHASGTHDEYIEEVNFWFAN
jgi:nucleoside-diphosphate kinase